MIIILDKVSKRFNQDWLFKDLDFKFSNGNSYAITGPNGSGKTTLLKVIAGMTPCTRGKIKYQDHGQTIDPDRIYRYLSYAAPYMDLLEELTLREFYRFHFHLKPNSGLSLEEIAAGAGIGHALDKPIHEFSSGMKQRAKLALCLYSNAPLMLLDEPTTNLDESGISWYLREIKRVKSEKLLIICSNQPYEYDFCEEQITMGR